MSRLGDNDRQHEVFTRRALILAGGGGAALAMLTWRLHQLQLVESAQYRLLSEGNQFNHLPAPPPRGRVLDRAGRILAGNEEVWLVRIRRDRADERLLAALLDHIDPPPTGEDPLREGRRASRLARWRRALRRARRFDDVTLEADLPWDAFARVNLNIPDLPGVIAAAGESRAYGVFEPDGSRRDGDAFAHVIGYVARPSEEDVAARLDAAEERDRSAVARIVRHPEFRAGRAGLERSLDETLQGDWGERRVEVDARGRVIRDLGLDKPTEAGADVRLTLDSALQTYAHERLAGESAGCVVMNAQTGAIRALISAPGFDPNRFARGIEAPAYRALVADPRTPLFNKPMDGLYPPGSTFKMLSALAFLRAGEDPTERIFCNGRYRLGDRTFHCWKEEGHGAMDMRDSLKKSCDVYYYEMGKRVGVDAIAAEARRFGLGVRYDLGLPGGRSGLVPDRAWKRAELGEAWAQGETLNTAIGQGFLTSSPLQLAVMTARLVNGGRSINPYLLESLAPDPEALAALEPLADPEHLEMMKDAMFAVAEEAGGTAYWSLGAKGLDLPGVKMGGKTGTSQVRRITAEERAAGVFRNEDLPWRRRDHALFVAYAPHDAPRYVVALVVEHGGSGSRAAAPPARDILREAIRLDPGPFAAADAPAESAG